MVDHLRRNKASIGTEVINKEEIIIGKVIHSFPIIEIDWKLCKRLIKILDYKNNLLLLLILI